MINRLGSLVAVFATGLLFGLGLILSGMVDPGKVKGFLDIAGNWDPSLSLVMGSAVAVALPAFQWFAPRQGDARSERKAIDRPLIFGSILFGIGWGISGYCPGPALVAASGGSVAAFVYTLGMVAGMVLGERIAASPGAAQSEDDALGHEPA